MHEHELRLEAHWYRQEQARRMPKVILMAVDCEPATIIGRDNHTAAYALKDAVLAALEADDGRGAEIKFTIWKTVASEEEIQTRQDW